MKKLKFLMASILAFGMIFGVGLGSVFAELKTVEVKKGDTLWSIAQSHGISIYDLYEWNGYALDPYNLQIGTEVVVHPASDWYHTVEKGDTFYSIAAQYDGLTVRDLFLLNYDLDADNLQIGSKVRLKVIEYQGILYHTIKPGDTLFSIALFSPGVTLDALYHLNPGIDPYNLKIGSKIRIY